MLHNRRECQTTSGKGAAGGGGWAQLVLEGYIYGEVCLGPSVHIFSLVVGTADAVDEESFNARRSSAVILTPLDPRSLRVSGFAVFSSGSDASGPQEFAGSLVSRPYVSEGGCPDSLRHDISLSVGHFPPLRTPCTLVPLSGTNRPRCPHSLPQSLQICVSPKRKSQKKRKIFPKKKGEK